MVARKNLNRTLKMFQQIGDRAGEATTWHQLVTIDLKVGDYAAAREKFNRSLEIKQQIGDRAEAATWHQLATIDVVIGDDTAAREKLNRSFEIKQQISDRAGEAATFNQLGLIGWKTGQRAEGARLIALSYALLQSIGNSKARIAAESFAEMAEQLGYDEARRQTLLAEVVAAYQQDGGAGLMQAAWGAE